MKLEEEMPMFKKQKVTFDPPESITHMVVSNNLVIIAMANQELLRLDLMQPDKREGELEEPFLK